MSIHESITPDSGPTSSLVFFSLQQQHQHEKTQRPRRRAWEPLHRAQVGTRSATPPKTLSRKSPSYWTTQIQTSSSPSLSIRAHDSTAKFWGGGEPRAPILAPFCSSAHLTALSGLICHCGVHKTRAARSWLTSCSHRALTDHQPDPQLPPLKSKPPDLSSSLLEPSLEHHHAYILSHIPYPFSSRFSHL